MVFLGVMIAIMVVLSVVLARLSLRGTRSYLRRYARRRGWEWSARSRELPAQFTSVESGPFPQKWRAVHVMRFAVEAGMSKAFTVVPGRLWKEISGSSRFSVIALDLPCPLPLLQVQPVRRTANYADSQGVQFEWQEFNDAWQIYGEDPQMIHAVINPRMMQWLMDPPSEPRRIVHKYFIDGPVIYTFHRGDLDATLIERRAQELGEFVKRIPDLVWS